MTAFNRLVLSLLVLRAGVEGVEEKGMKPMSAREEMKSCRRVVMSRMVVCDRKFFVRYNISGQIKDSMIFFLHLHRTILLPRVIYLQILSVHIHRMH